MKTAICKNSSGIWSFIFLLIGGEKEERAGFDRLSPKLCAFDLGRYRRRGLCFGLLPHLGDIEPIEEVHRSKNEKHNAYLRGDILDVRDGSDRFFANFEE